MSAEHQPLPDDVDALKALVLASRAEVEHLKLIIAKLKRLQFGRHSEKLDHEIEQLELRLEELQVSAVPAPSTSVEKPARQAPARKPLPEHLPRTRIEHTPACACPDCGAAMRQIGEDVSEVLDYVPARFRVIQHVRPKLACPACERIVQVPAPSRPIERGLAGAGLLAHVLVSKYADHLPLYRQAQIYAREGVPIERSTMAEWVAGCFRLLDPLVEALAGYVMSGGKLHADDTPVPVLDPGRGRTKTGRLWTYVRDDRAAGSDQAPAVLLRYAPDRSGERPENTWRRSAVSCRPTPMLDSDTSTRTAESARRRAGRTRGAVSMTFTRPTLRRSRARRSSVSARSTRSKPTFAANHLMRGRRSARRAPDRCSSRCASGYTTRSRALRRSRHWRWRSATCSRAGRRSPATWTMAASRSTTTPLSERCAWSRSGARTTSSAVPMPEASVPRPSTA